MLNKWKSYLLENFKKLNKIEDYGALYERFISNFPELRKEFGVFYTPEYIVEYIVKQTVGELIAHLKHIEYFILKSLFCK